MSIMQIKTRLLLLLIVITIMSTLIAYAKMRENKMTNKVKHQNNKHKL